MAKHVLSVQGHNNTVVERMQLYSPMWLLVQRVRDATGRVVEVTRDAEHKLMHLDLPQLAPDGVLGAVRIQVQGARNLVTHMLDPHVPFTRHRKARRNAQRQKRRHEAAQAAQLQDVVSQNAEQAGQEQGHGTAKEGADVQISSDNGSRQGAQPGGQETAHEEGAQCVGAGTCSEAALAKLRDGSVRVVVSKAANGKLFCVVDESSIGNGLLVVDVTALACTARKRILPEMSLVSPVLFLAASSAPDEQCASTLPGLNVMAHLAYSAAR